LRSKASWKELSRVNNQIYKAKRDIEKALEARERLRVILDRLCSLRYKRGNMWVEGRLRKRGTDKEREVLASDNLTSVLSRLMKAVY